MYNQFQQQYIDHLIRIANDYPKPLTRGNRARSILMFFGVERRRAIEVKETKYPHWYLGLKQFKP